MERNTYTNVKLISSNRMYATYMNFKLSIICTFAHKYKKEYQELYGFVKFLLEHCNNKCMNVLFNLKKRKEKKEMCGILYFLL